MKEFADYLRQLRLRHDYTQEYVGNVLNISYSTYGKYELGSSRLHLEQAVKLAQLYKLSLDDFYAMKYESDEHDSSYYTGEPPTPKEALYRNSKELNIIVSLDGSMNSLQRTIQMLTNINTALSQ